MAQQEPSGGGPCKPKSASAASCKPSAGAIRAALEISEKVSALPVYRQALVESFAETIEQHTQCGQLQAAAQLAKETLSLLHAPTRAVELQRQAVLAALERATTGGSTSASSNLI